jgi:TRAP-type mannitol/chloroaromatic compound transport system substrate-binding protein
MNSSLGFHDVAKYPILHFHSLPVYEITVNQERWDAQPDDIKAILEMSVRDLSTRINLEDMIAERTAITAEQAEGVDVVIWSDEDLKAMRGHAREVWQEYAKASPMAQKAFDAQVGFMTRLGLID